MTTTTQRSAIKRIKEATKLLYPDRVRSVASKSITLRWEYYHRHGRTAELFLERVTAAIAPLGLPSVTITCQDVERTWPMQSYFEVTVRVWE